MAGPQLQKYSCTSEAVLCFGWEQQEPSRSLQQESLGKSLSPLSPGRFYLAGGHLTLTDKWLLKDTCVYLCSYL